MKLYTLEPRVIEANSLGPYLPSVLWYCWLGLLTRKISIPEGQDPDMTYNVFGGTLNLSLYYTTQPSLRVCGQIEFAGGSSSCVPLTVHRRRRYCVWTVVTCLNDKHLLTTRRSPLNSASWRCYAPLQKLRPLESPIGPTRRALLSLINVFFVRAEHLDALSLNCLYTNSFCHCIGKDLPKWFPCTARWGEWCLPTSPTIVHLQCESKK